MSKAKTWGQWTEEGAIKHGGYYLYILPEGGDVNMLFGCNDKLIIQCPIHGEFTQKANSHCNSGRGCPKCADKSRSINNTRTWGSWTELGSKMHNGKFRYILPEGGYYDMPFKYNDKLIIECPEHGIFEQKASAHSNIGNGCPKCSRGVMAIGRNRTWGYWTELGSKTHNGKFRYILPKGGYYGMPFKYNDKLIIECPEHGIFEQGAGRHSKTGSGCSECARIMVAIGRTRTWGYWTELGSKTHNGKFRYILPEGGYYDMPFKYNDKLIIECPEHGIFEQGARLHSKTGHGCHKCSCMAMTMSKIKTWGYWTELGSKTHNGKFRYILPKCGYYDMPFRGRDKLTIECPEHGIFEQMASVHSHTGHGCSKCKFISRGEAFIELFLNSFNINYTKEFKFYGSKLRYDFKLDNPVLLIEYDGMQHHYDRFFTALFKSKSKGQAAFAAQQKRDRLKDELAAKHGMKLIRIPYWEYDNIEKILAEALAPYASSVQMAVDVSAVTQAT